MINVDFILFNKLAILAFILLFSAAVLLLNRFASRRISVHRVPAMLKTCIAGLVLLFFEVELSNIEQYGKYVQTLQSLVVILSSAMFVNYIIADVYIRLKTNKEPPSFLRDVVSLLVYLVCAFVALRIVFKVNPASLFTTSAVLTAALAFAMQNTVSNIFSGFAIQFDQFFRRGTWVTLNDKGITGEVENIGFRATTLKTLEDYRITVPNGVLLQNIVTSYGNVENSLPTAVLVKVGLSYEMPPETAKDIVLQALGDCPEVLASPDPVVNITAFLDSSIEYEIKFFVADFAKRNAIRNRVLSTLWYAMSRGDYDFPYPHREVIAKTPRPFPVIEPGEVVSLLRNTEIFAGLDEQQLDALAANATMNVYGPNEVIIREGEEGESLFIVRKGKLDVQIGGSVVGTLGSGSFFGEMSLLTGEPRKATVIAARESYLVEISKGILEPVLRRHPSLVEHLSTVLAERARANLARQDAASAFSRQVHSKDAMIDRLRKFFGL